MRTYVERFNASWTPEPTSGCWLWTRSINVDGYGLAWRDGEFRLAHRVAFELHAGRPPPPGMMVCHRCDVRSCVNPAHLFLGTARDNARDMVRKGRDQNTRKTHCKRGHPLTPDNLRKLPPKFGSRRDCIACTRIRDAANRAIKRERIAA